MIYTVKTAAKYLDVSEATIRHHIYNTKNLPQNLLGHTIVFTQEELDAFKKLDIKPGRPPKS